MVSSITPQGTPSTVSGQLWERKKRSHVMDCQSGCAVVVMVQQNEMGVLMEVEGECKGKVGSVYERLLHTSASFPHR